MFLLIHFKSKFYTPCKKSYIYIHNASDDVASRTRSQMTIKARNERARLDKAQKRSQNIPSRSLTSEDESIE